MSTLSSDRLLNDSSALPVSPSAQADTHSLLLFSLNYLPANPDQKVKKQVKRESLMLSNERGTHVNSWVCLSAVGKHQLLLL